MGSRIALRSVGRGGGRGAPTAKLSGGPGAGFAGIQIERVAGARFQSVGRGGGRGAPTENAPRRRGTHERIESRG